LKPKSLLIAGTGLSVLLSLVLLGCSSKPSSNDVLAKVNGKKILRSEVDKYFLNQTAGAPQQVNGEQADELRLNILQKLIEETIVAQRAEKDGLMATDDEVDRKLSEIKTPYTEEEFQRGLTDRHMTVKDLKEELRRSITVDKVLNKEIFSRIEIKDSDVKAYYDAHKAEFNLVEPQYHLAHILVTVGPMQVRNLKNSKAQGDAEAQKKIHELLNRLDSGEDFAMVASNWSEDPETAPNGGDLGTTPESGLKNSDAASREAVLKLKTGQYSGVIAVYLPNSNSKQVWGYRIVKLVDKLPAGQRDLGDPRVQEFIRGRLRQGSEQLRRAAFYEVLRNQAKVEDYYAETLLKTASK
jgi:peptidyl-prolyl cis-trans isomerase SurA